MHQLIDFKTTMKRYRINAIHQVLFNISNTINQHILWSLYLHRSYNLPVTAHARR